MLNLGSLAHVDAGKTSLTERLLYTAGVIDEVGSVDDGSTQTDSLELERQRGITIKSAVVSFAVDDVTVNLIDTPGHPDFIAEVERVLSVLDGAVLVVSAVEGVQPQTRVLMRTLQRLRVPTLIFVNKIDRGGARYDRVLQGISEKLTAAIIPMGSASGLGTRGARFTPYAAADAGFTSRMVDLLADHDDAFLAAYVDDETAVSYGQLRGELAAQSRQALVHPVFFGSAITGAGVDSLIAGVKELLPAAAGEVDGPVSGAVFKVERGPAGEKIAYVRMFSGTVRTRDRLRFRRDDEGKVTAISVFDRGSAVQRASVAAGQIGKLWGLGDVQIGDCPAALCRPTDAGDGGRPGPPRRQGCAARRAHPARRAGPTDQPAPGRDSAGDVRVALRRGAERGRPGDAGERLRHRRQLPRDDHHLHRTAGRQRRGRRDDRRGAQSVPRDRRAAHRAGSGRHRRAVPAGGRARVAAVLVRQGGRGDRERDAAAGHLRMAGHRLHGHHDALRLLGAPEPRPCRLRQEHVEHRRGLPQLDAAGLDERTEAGRHQGVRADAPLPARRPRGHARTGVARAGTPARRSADTSPARLVVPPGGRDPGGTGARAAATAAGADPRRRRA